MRGVAHDPVLRAKLMAMHQQGVTLAALSAEFGVAREVLSRFIGQSAFGLVAHAEDARALTCKRAREVRNLNRIARRNHQDVHDASVCLLKVELPKMELPLTFVERSRQPSSTRTVLMR